MEATLHHHQTRSDCQQWDRDDRERSSVTVEQIGAQDSESYNQKYRGDAKVRLDHRGRILPVVGELGDSKKRLYRGLVPRIDAKHLAVDRDRAELVVELPLHHVAELMCQRDPLSIVRGRISPALQDLDQVLRCLQVYRYF